ncbi:MAG TPA: type II secretion system secretin GspD [Smithellaceae bacterium]|nr:type II secretion system secretin GspD [Smithellaceae bacterium]
MKLKSVMQPFFIGLAVFAAGCLTILFLSAPLSAARLDTGQSPPSAASADETSASSRTDAAAEPAPAAKADQPEALGAAEAGGDSALAPKKDRPKKRVQPRKQKQEEKYVTLDFDNVNIETFVKFVSELVGKNFIIDDKVRGKVTIISPNKIPLSDVYKVFLSVLEMNGFATVPVGDMVKIVPAATAREKSVETRIVRDGVETDDRIVTQIIALDRANPDEVKRVLDPIVPRTSSVLSYPPAGVLIITDYLSNVRRIEEIIRALDVEEAGDQITYVALQNASASEVVKSLSGIFQQRRPNVRSIRLVADTRTNSVIIFASVSDTEGVRRLIALMDKDVPRGESNIQVYRLQNAVAEDLAKVLTSIVRESSSSAGSATAAAPGAPSPVRSAPVVSRNVQIVPDKATNTLVIMAEREDYKIMENIIKQLDVPRAMVYIEALIMEVNATKDFNLGVEWRGVKDTGSITGFDNARSAGFIGSGTGLLPSATAIADTTLSALAFPSGFSMGIIGAGIKIGEVVFPTIGAMVQAYKHDKDVSILSTPQLMTLDNEEAEINVGSNVPYITRQESTTTSTLVNYNTYEYKDVGVVLNITPNINEENLIRLKISQEVTKVTSGADKATPTTLKRTVKTTVVIKDKETIVIGGLIGDSTDDNVNKVPLLGEIPLLGWLFKSKSQTREKTNLYVFLTPQIVRTQQDAEAIFSQKRESMGEVVDGVIRLNERRPRAEGAQPETAQPDGPQEEMPQPKEEQKPEVSKPEKP